MSHYLEDANGDKICGYEFSKWIGWDYDAESQFHSSNKSDLIQLLLILN
jgi:hypothetical protein